MLGKTYCNGSKGELGVDLTLRTTEVRAENNSCTLIHKILDCGKSCNDSLVIGDVEVIVLLYIEVATDKNTLALRVDVFNCLLVVIHKC